MSSFGRELRKARREAKVSLRSLADSLGISHVMLGEVERGVRFSLSRTRWALLVECLPNVTTDDLLSWELEASLQSAGEWFRQASCFERSAMMSLLTLRGCTTDISHMADPSKVLDCDDCPSDTKEAQDEQEATGDKVGQCTCMMCTGDHSGWNHVHRL